MNATDAKKARLKYCKEWVARFSKGSHGLLVAVQEALDADMPVYSMEKIVRTLMISEAVVQTQGNMSKAARRLGIHRNTLTRDFDEAEEFFASPPMLDPPPNPAVSHSPVKRSKSSMGGAAKPKETVSNG